MNVEVKASDDLHPVKYGDRTLVPNFIRQDDPSLLALNVRIGRQWVDYELMKQWIKRLHLQHACQFIGILLVDLLHIDPKDVLFTSWKEEDRLPSAEKQLHSIYLAPRSMGLFKYAPTESLATLWGAWVVRMKSVEE